jgi:hypothetical protein
METALKWCHHIKNGGYRDWIRQPLTDIPFSKKLTRISFHYLAQFSLFSS